MTDQNKIKNGIELLRNQMFKIEVEVLEGGRLPCKAHPTDAGFDVFATSDIELWPGQVQKHPLNIRMKLPRGTWARIETKSGLGSKGHFVYAGVIDNNYRGVPHVIMTNLNSHDKQLTEGGLGMVGIPLIIKSGSKLAQITMNNHSDEYFMVQVDSVSTDTDRAQGGFGSSGV